MVRAVEEIELEELKKSLEELGEIIRKNPCQKTHSEHTGGQKKMICAISIYIAIRDQKVEMLKGNATCGLARYEIGYGEK